MEQTRHRARAAATKTQRPASGASVGLIPRAARDHGVSSRVHGGPSSLEEEEEEEETRCWNTGSINGGEPRFWLLHRLHTRSGAGRACSPEEARDTWLSVSRPEDAAGELTCTRQSHVLSFIMEKEKRNNPHLNE